MAELFDVPALAANPALATEVQQLKQFCRYRPQVPTAVAPQLPQGLAELVRDGAAIAPSACAVANPLAPLLLRRFAHEAGALSLPLQDLPQATVRLALLDSEPNREGLGSKPGSSDHGFALARIAQGLLCSVDKECPIKISTRLAMPYLEFSSTEPDKCVRDDQNGGVLGLVTDLAVAITDELDSWVSASLNENRPRLVLNLSLAWDPAHFEGSDATIAEDLPAPVRAVYRALEAARKLDVLVFAASGNRKGGPRSQIGPLLPAAWEAGLSREPAGRPLVYAVGGVQESNVPLANARVSSSPARVAIGSAGVALTGETGQFTPVLTGSSVATVVVASAAAAVWRLRPELPAADVVAQLQASGEELRRHADLFPGGSQATAPGVRRIRVCQAVAAVAAGGANGGFCFKQEAWDDSLLKTEADACQKVEIALPANDPGLETRPNPCQAERLLIAGELEDWQVDALCPVDQFNAVSDQPWLYPQPETTPCPSCVAVPPPKGMEPNAASTNSGYTLYIEISEKWNGWDLYVASLVVENADGKVSSFPVQQELKANESRVIKGLGAGEGGDWQKAYLSILATHGTEQASVTNPVFIAPPPNGL